MIKFFELILKSIAFIGLFSITVFSQTQFPVPLATVPDTSSLKTMNAGYGTILFLQQNSSSDSTGGGWFVVRDSVQEEGSDAFNHPNPGWQWIREEPSINIRDSVEAIAYYPGGPNVVDLDVSNELTISGSGNVDIDALQGGTPYKILVTQSTGYIDSISWGTANTFLGGNGVHTEPSFQLLENEDIPNDITINSSGSVSPLALQGTSWSLPYTGLYGNGAELAFGEANMVLKSGGTANAPYWGSDLTGSGGASYADSITHNSRHVTGDSVVVASDFGTWEMMYTDASGLFNSLSLGADNYALFSTGTSTAPEFRTIVSGDIYGGLDIGHISGGNWKMIYTNGSGVGNELALGPDNYALFSTGIGTAPEFRTIYSGDLYDVSDIAIIDEARTITGNWVNTTFPWRNNEVSDTLTINEISSVDIDALESGTANRLLRTDSQGELDYITFGGAQTFLEGTSPPAFVSLGDEDIPNTITIDIDYLENGTANRVLITDSQGEATYVAFDGYGYFLGGNGESTPPSFKQIDINYLIDNETWDIYYSNGSNQITGLSLGPDNYALFSTGTGSAPEFRTIYSGDLYDVASVAIIDEARTITGNWDFSSNKLDDDDIINSISIDGDGNVDFDALGSGSQHNIINCGNVGYLEYTPWGAYNTFLMGNGVTAEPSFAYLNTSKLTDNADIAMLDEAETIGANWDFSSYPLNANEINAVDMDVLQGGTPYSILNSGSTGYKEYTPWGAANTFLGGNGTTAEPSFQSLTTGDLPSGAMTGGAQHFYYVGDPSSLSFLPGWKVPYNITITEIAGYTAGTSAEVDINVEERAEATPNSAGQDAVQAEVTLDTGNTETHTFANADFAQNTWMTVTISGTNGSPTMVSVTVRYTKD